MRVGFAGKALLITCALYTVGCLRDDASGALTPSEESSVLAWLECIECSEGELDSVIAIAHRTSAVLDTLDLRATRGPPEIRRLETEQQLANGFDRDTAWARLRTTNLDSLGWSNKSAHVAEFLDRYVTLVRHRAAIGLGCIGSDSSLALLANQSVGDSLPPEVHDWLLTARDSFADPGYRAKQCR